MATMNIKVQHIDSILPDMRINGGVMISCNMDMYSMELTIAKIREQLSEEEWNTIVKNTI